MCSGRENPCNDWLHVLKEYWFKVLAMCVLSIWTTSLVQNWGPPLDAQGGPSDTYSVMTKIVKENLEDAY